MNKQAKTTNMSLKDENTRKEILTHAQKLFQQYGAKKTTMDEIAAACGKAKSTLYHYFTNKEEVFDAVIEMEIINLRAHVKNKVEEQRKMCDKIKVYALEFHREVAKRNNLYRIISQDTAVGIATRKHFLRMMDFEKSYIVRILEDGYDSGEYRSVIREDIPMIAETLLAAIYGTVLYVIEKEGFFDEQKICKLIDHFIPKIFG